ncbi:MAG TPA: nitroreductase/quinone reductase family protein [Marmoricola sp.]|nr:nitroreductase/quinone reductase family protein [Marmoricola sp.]
MKLSTQAFLLGLKAHQALYEGSHGLVGHRLLLMPTLLLRTTGRKSGLTRTNALVYGRDGARYLVCGSNGGHDLPPAWALNMEAEPEVEFQVGVRRRRATATTLRPGDADYERLFAICNRANRGQFAAYQKKTDRPLPVFVITPH